MASGDVSYQTLNITPETLQATFSTEFGSSVNLTLIKPDGEVITPTIANQDYDISYNKSLSQEYYQIDNPMAGTWQMKMEAVDVDPAGEDVGVSAQAVIETNPQVTINTPQDEAIVRGQVEVSAQAQDDEEVEDFDLSLNGEQLAVSQDKQTLNYTWDTASYEDGSYQLSAIAVDPKGSFGQADSIVVVDNVLPMANAGGDQQVDPGAEVTFDGSGSTDVTEFGYSWDFGDGERQEFAGPQVTHTYESPGRYSVALTATDAASNVSTDTTQVTVGLADDIPPQTSIILGEPKYGESPAYVNSQTQFSLTAADDSSGVAKTEYKADTGAWITYQAPFTISGEGAHTISYRSTDNTGNQEQTKALDVYVDDTPPEVALLNPLPESIHIYKEPLQTSLSLIDSGSGLSSYKVTLNGEDITLAILNPLSLNKLGENTLTIEATDNLGNKTIDTHLFYVTYGVDWLPPLKYMTEYDFYTYTMQDGSTLPLKFTISDYFGNTVEDPTLSLKVYDRSNPLNQATFYQGTLSDEIRSEPDTGSYIVNLHTGGYSWMTPSTTNYYEVEILSQGNNSQAQESADYKVNLLSPSNFQIIEKGKAKGK